MSDKWQVPRSRVPTFGSGFRGGAVFGVVFGLTFGLMLTTNAVPGLGLGVIVAVFAGFGLAAFIIHVIVNVRQVRRFVRENNNAIGMLARGELEHAHAIFWRWAEHTRVPIVAAVARHNVACTLVRQGELQHAIEVYADNEKRFERGLKAAALHPTSAADLALTHALAGNLADAEAWLTRADERADQPSQPAFPLMRLYARAVIDCRNGRTAEAAKQLDERWSEAEAMLAGDNLRPLRVVRAFAHAATDLRSAGVAELLLASSKPMYAGEYDHLGVAWPEMQQFLAANQLG